MGVKGIAEMESIAPSSMVESYLRKIVNLVGKPVEVQVKDGSVFAGTFFTTSVEGQGIVLKEAELTEWSGCESNVASGVIVETLVILSKHIVQVVSNGEVWFHFFLFFPCYCTPWYGNSI